MPSSALLANDTVHMLARWKTFQVQSLDVPKPSPKREKWLDITLAEVINENHGPLEPRVGPLNKAEIQANPPGP